MSRKPHSPVDPEEIKRRLSVMHASYRAKVPGKVAEIEALWRRARVALPGDDSRNDLLLAAHTLVGSSPSLGCEALGAAAADLERALRAAFAHDGALSGDEAAAIGVLVKKLGSSLN